MLIENEDIAKVFRHWVSIQNSGNVHMVAELAIGEIGFGFKTMAWRGPTEIGTALEILIKWWSSLEYYNMELEELNTSAEGNIGLAWGFYIEKLKGRAQPIEQIRVRFSNIYKKEEKGWRSVMYHRDIQQFDKDGRYIAQSSKG